MKIFLSIIAIIFLVACDPIKNPKSPVGVEVRYAFESLKDQDITVCVNLGNREFVIKRFKLLQPNKTEYITRVAIPNDLISRVSDRDKISLQCDQENKNIWLLESKFLY